MRKAAFGGLAAAALIVVVGLFAADVWAQAPTRALPRTADLMMLGGGSQIGVSVRDLRDEEIASVKLEQPGGALIEDVREESPAARAGLGRGDIVVEFDGERVRSARHFGRLVRETPAGRGVRSSVLRDGARRSVDITPDAGDRLTMGIPDVGPAIERGMRALPRNFNFDFEPPDFDLPAPGVRIFTRARLGITMAPLTDQLAAYFGGKEGVLVSAVESGSPAAAAGLTAGDVITTIGGSAVDSPGDVTRVVREAAPGAALDVRLIRDKKEMTVKVTLPERNEERRGGLPV
jgi:serine protease Do